MGLLSAVPAALPLQAWRFPSSEDAALVLAIGANCVLILAPLRSALRAAQEELPVEEILGLVAPTYALFAQCFFWACYGFCSQQPDILHFNAFGAVMCIVYLAFIARGSRPKTQTRVLVAASVALTVVFSIGVVLTPMSVLDHGQVFALTATLFSFLQSLAPMYQALEAVRCMSPAGFPLAVAGASCASSLLWAQYAIMVGDMLYFASNALNALVGVSQLAIVGWVTYSAATDPVSKLQTDSQPLMPRLGRTLGFAGCKNWLDSQGVQGQYGAALERAFGAYAAAGKAGPDAAVSAALQDLNLRAAKATAYGGKAMQEDFSAGRDNLRHSFQGGDFKPSLDCVL